MFIGWSRDKNLISVLILLVLVIDSGAGHFSRCAPCVHNRVYIMTRLIFYTYQDMTEKEKNTMFLKVL